MSRWVVLLKLGDAYGPVEDPELARQFAEFMTREVDPAEAVRLTDPVDELLAFAHRRQSGPRPVGWPPVAGEIWQDSGGDRWVCTRTSGKHAYLVCLARMADDSAEEIWRQHGPMTRVALVAPTKDEEPPF